MDSQEFQELTDYIRASLRYSVIGLNSQEIQQLNQRLDSDAYKAAQAVEEFFEAKRNESKD